MGAWGIANAKAQLSQIIHEAETEGPQTLERNGRRVAVVLSVKEWDRYLLEKESSEKEESMADFFMRSPLRNSGLEIKRSKWKPRELDL